jgi:predicted dehydrogenase
MNQTLRYGIIGTGQRGRAHLARLLELQPAVRIAALCDPVPEALDAAADLCREHQPARYDRYERLVADANVDAVVVASPNHLHRDHAVGAFAQGKHVLCEKPLATSVADAQAILDASVQAGRILCPGHELRFARPYLELKAALPRIGRICQVTHHEYRRDWSPLSWVYRDPGTGRSLNWRMSQKASGGTILEKSLHFVDLFHLLLGANPARVALAGGIGFYRDGRETWDQLTISLVYADGVTATHSLCMFHQPAESTLRIFGEKGVFVVEGHSKVSHYDYGRPATVIYDAGVGENSLAYQHLGDTEMHEAFAAAVQGRKPLPILPRIGVEAVATCLRS